MNILDVFYVVLGLKNDQFKADLQKSGKALEDFKNKEAKLDENTAKKSADTDKKLAAEKKKQQQADQRAQKEREAMLKKTEEGYRKIIGTIAQVTGVTLGLMGFKNFISDSISAQAQLRNVATDTGQSVRQLDAMGKTLETVGGKYEDAAQNAEAYSKAVNDAQHGRANPFMKGLSTILPMSGYMDANGKLKDEKTLMIEISKAFQTTPQYKNNQQEQAHVIDQMGLSRSALYLLRRGPEYIEKNYDDFHARNAGVEESADAAIRYQQALGRVKDKLQEVGQAIFVKLEPQIDKFLDWLNKFADWVVAHKDEIGQFFSDVGGVILWVAKAFKKVNDATGGAAGTLVLMGAAFVALKGIIGTLASMTGIPMLIRVLTGLGTGAKASAGLMGLLSGKLGPLAAKLGLLAGKLSLLAGAAYAGWEAGSWINDQLGKTERGQSIQHGIGDAGLGVLRFFGLAREEGEGVKLSADSKQGLADPKVQEQLRQMELREKSQQRVAPVAKALQDQTDLQQAQVDLAQTANLAGDAQTSLLQQINDSINKVNDSIRQAFAAGQSGHPLPGGGNASGPAKLAYAAGKTTATAAAWAGNMSDTIVNGFARIMTRAEGDYDVVNTGARHGYKAARANLPDMTVAQVMAAQARGDFNAAGRYQIIGTTLREAVQNMGLSGNEKFDKSMQDKIFTDYLLKHKRKAIADYIEGKSNDLKAALLALSQEWASFADPFTGRSHYAKNGIDRASVPVPQGAQMLNSMRASFAAQGAVNNTHTETHINGPINIQTAATDARGIARELPRATRNAFNDNAALAAA